MSILGCPIQDCECCGRHQTHLIKHHIFYRTPEEGEGPVSRICKAFHIAITDLNTAIAFIDGRSISSSDRMEIFKFVKKMVRKSLKQ